VEHCVSKPCTICPRSSIPVCPAIKMKILTVSDADCLRQLVRSGVPNISEFQSFNLHLHPRFLICRLA
jgi:hypothetical protein